MSDRDGLLFLSVMAIVLVLLIVWAFSGSVYSVATGLNMDVVNAAVGIVDADR